jgi:integrase
MLKLYPPCPPRNPCYRIRGTYLHISVDQSTGARDEKTAKVALRKLKADIEAGTFTIKGDPTFAEKALSYMEGGGERRFMAPLLKHFGNIQLSKIDQDAINAAGARLYPNASPATRNRQVHTPVSAVLKHAGLVGPVRRPKGAQGRVRLDWLTPKQAGAFLNAAYERDTEFGVMLETLLYTGMRLGDVLGLECRRVDLEAATAYLPITKNGEPRLVHLPPKAVAVLASHPRGLARRGRLFSRWTKSRALYKLFHGAAKKAGIVLERRTGFHVFCHTWATWMRQHGADTKTLILTGRWKDEKSAGRYQHTVTTEAARIADLLPTDIRAKAIAGG